MFVLTVYFPHKVFACSYTNRSEAMADARAIIGGEGRAHAVIRKE